MHEDVFIGRGGLDGKGVYAARAFTRGEVVIHYNLRQLTPAELAALPEVEKQFVHVHWGTRYLYGEPERYVNHSSSPNTLQDLAAQCDIAARDILEGEQITTDAGKDDI